MSYSQIDVSPSKVAHSLAVAPGRARDARLRKLRPAKSPFDSALHLTTAAPSRPYEMSRQPQTEVILTARDLEVGC
eukprot:scaffold48156_cov30-Tisochrysis_lutea.AAC.3